MMTDWQEWIQEEGTKAHSHPVNFFSSVNVTKLGISLVHTQYAIAQKKTEILFLYLIDNFIDIIFDNLT